MTTSILPAIAPADVHAVLARHILADGSKLVFDLEKSHGAWVHDAHEHFGLEPDAIAFGKKAQVCGCMVGPRVDEEPENVFKVSSRINSTWGGGLTDMVRFGRFLEVIDEDRLVDNERVVGRRLLEGLQSLEQEAGGLLTNSRGLGLMIAFDLPTPEIREKMHERLLADGLLLLTCGASSVRFRPPLNLTAEEADTALDIVRKSLKEQ